MTPCSIDMCHSKLLISALVYLSISCSYELPEPLPPSVLDTGTADFERIAVLGGSQSAGFMDGALYTDGQSHSMGAILVNQINQTSPESVVFQQPGINSSNGYNPAASAVDTRGKYFIKFIDPGSLQLFKDTHPGEMPELYTGPPISNFSVPNLRSNQVMDPALVANPYYNRFASVPSTSTLIDELLEYNPTLLFLEMGWDDVLPYAVNGLTGQENGDPDQLGPADLTPVELFRSSLEQIMEDLITNTDAQIIMTNIPDVTAFPFFNSISPIAPINGMEAGLLQAFYRDYNLQVTRYNATAETLRPVIQFFSDDPPNLWKVVVEDPTLPEILLDDGSLLPKYRQMEDGEYVLWSVPQLPTAKEDGFGTFSPLHKSFFFTEQDIVNIQEVIQEFNEIISELIVTNTRAHLLDCHQIFSRWATEGIATDGVIHSYDFTRTGIFSADGLTLNRRGSALMSNQVIDLINNIYGSNIQHVDVNDFMGNEFVNDFD